MKTIALIEKGKDGTFGVYAPGLQHTVIGAGVTVESAKADFENSAREMVASYIDDGRTVPHELQDLKFEYKYDLASLFNFYDCINVSKFAKFARINATLMRQYKTGDAYISENQTRKIELALHRLGQELTAVKL